MKKRKKKWTTKNTHIWNRDAKKSKSKSKDWKLILIAWITIISAILFIVLVALNNHIVGYDHFLGIPREWIHSLIK